MSLLPQGQPLCGEQDLPEDKTLLICAEGFEDRGLSFVQSISSRKFSGVFVLTYQPTKKSRLPELMDACKARSDSLPRVLEYDRFHPAVFEDNFRREIDEVLG